MCCASQEQPSTSYRKDTRPFAAGLHRTCSRLVARAATLSRRREAAAPIRLFDSIQDAVTALAAGELVVVLDSEDRENEGDLVMSGDKVRKLAPKIIRQAKP